MPGAVKSGLGWAYRPEPSVLPLRPEERSAFPSHTCCCLLEPLPPSWTRPTTTSSQQLAPLLLSSSPLHMGAALDDGTPCLSLTQPQAAPVVRGHTCLSTLALDMLPPALHTVALPPPLASAPCPVCLLGDHRAIERPPCRPDLLLRHWHPPTAPTRLPHPPRPYPA
jgi:hypothetical protein